MSWIVRLTRQAEEDLRRARLWYRREAPHVAPAFLAEVRGAHRRIAGDPWQYPDVHRGLRRALVHRFPYGIFYRLVGDTVQVVAIVHLRSRDLAAAGLK